jgi:hydroxymethylglutaryl-CoA reductase (NADPH)
VPIGLAGPIRINGEHAQGDFYVPLATSEGTLVASYNRGMRLLTESGGVKATVVEQSMQRGPVFILADALAAREFGRWVDEHYALIKGAAEATTRSGKLINIGQYSVGPLRYLRFNYTTGDAAGQNMTGKATLAACEWIHKNYPGETRFILSGNIDTDKKHSRINMLLTRGKRVVAEAVIRNDLLKSIMGVDTKTLFWARQISMAGAFLVGSANNGAHAANGLTALFIATGQDVANVSESHAGIVYAQLLDSGDYYWSITLPSLIRQGQGEQVRRNLRGHRARRRDLADRRHPARRLGLEPRPARPESPVKGLPVNRRTRPRHGPGRPHDVLSHTTMRR